MNGNVLWECTPQDTKGSNSSTTNELTAEGLWTMFLAFDSGNGLISCRSSLAQHARDLTGQSSHVRPFGRVQRMALMPREFYTLGFALVALDGTFVRKYVRGVSTSAYSKHRWWTRYWPWNCAFFEVRVTVCSMLYHEKQVIYANIISLWDRVLLESTIIDIVSRVLTKQSKRILPTLSVSASENTFI